MEGLVSPCIYKNNIHGILMNNQYLTWLPNMDIWRFSPLKDLTCIKKKKNSSITSVYFQGPIQKKNVKFQRLQLIILISHKERHKKLCSRDFKELTVRIAENVSVAQSDMEAWANPWALKTGTVDRLYTAEEIYNGQQQVRRHESSKGVPKISRTTF